MAAFANAGQLIFHFRDFVGRKFRLMKQDASMMNNANQLGLVPSQCPTSGINSQLFNRNSDTPSQCHFFDVEKEAGRFIGCDDFPEVHDCIDGFCCPTRALTCIQPVDNGELTDDPESNIERWFHNPVTNLCQSFQFTGFGGNSNNFFTREHCESYCLMRCSRGQPQVYPRIHASSLITSSVVPCSSQDESCYSNYFECTRIEGDEFCCPKLDFICSEWGGLLGKSFNFLSTVLPYSSGSNRMGQKATTRWYWDREDKTCRTFKFYGQGGNFNNFLSEEHCHSYCSRVLCSIGSPLRDNSGSILTCTSAEHCPRSHTCHEGICCPTEQYVTSLFLLVLIVTPRTPFATGLTSQLESVKFSSIMDVKEMTTISHLWINARFYADKSKVLYVSL
uniref:Kunitz/Bovine pancreatic trypsin inhibitor domain protein n=1 Tax=Heterorhabditis bacteriophora TaxID=37862 RepID=A0A1I7XAJ1_HETBA